MTGQKIKERIYGILEETPYSDLYNTVFDIFIVTLILLNVVAVVLETVHSLASRFMYFFHAFEFFSIAVFTIEYILRMWTCTSNVRFRRPFRGRLRYAVTPMAIVDLLAVLPFYLPMILTLDLRFIRALRLFRLIRLFKIERYSESLRTLGSVFKEKKEELLITVFTVFILVVIASSLMYFVENEAQPKSFGSIPAAMWWGVATLTTVGYGDVYPITPLGKFLGAIIAFLGIGMFAVPTGIIGAGLVSEVQSKREKKRLCPHCGKDIDEPPEKSPDDGQKR